MVFQHVRQDKTDQPYDIQNKKAYDMQNDPQICIHPFTSMNKTVHTPSMR